MLATD